MKPGVYEAVEDSTIYRLTVLTDEVHLYVLAETGWASGCGQWMVLDRFEDSSIAWSYLVEKMPGLEKFPGDKPGWVMVFKRAGIEVFH